MKSPFPFFRVLLLVALVLGTATAASARRMRDVFASAPDSIFPLLTTNNRLDCIDFIENAMPARVKNLMDETVELTALTDTYLSLTLSVAERIDMRLLPLADSTHYVALVRTYFGPVGESVIEFYTSDWRPLPQAKQLVLPRYEDFFVQSDTLPRADLKEFGRLFTYRLVQAALSPSAPTLTFTLSLDELPEEVRREVAPYVRPQIYRWNVASRRFVRE